ncbi:hypothetical protein BDV41DRAFT_538821 [Aspergillus transmontanensis]|uniref:Uncharacterized protein n=1 Tax=Aspergillus transmontanensis TaxID=1034304 RepID=A0A5N6VWD9_9EURO|nr:hypothetical protein BDV41DRAFT_538821 [Aspergillus transmontanensis]
MSCYIIPLSLLKLMHMASRIARFWSSRPKCIVGTVLGHYICLKLISYKGSLGALTREPPVYRGPTLSGMGVH